MTNPPAIRVLCLLLVVLGTHRVSETLGKRPSVSVDAHTSGFLLIGERVPINTGSAAALESVPGVGPALAQRIVGYRRNHGDFATPDELVRISGIGPVTRDRIAPFLSWQPSSHTLAEQTPPRIQGLSPHESPDHDLP